MKDSEKSKEQLIQELEGLRARVAQLEKRSVLEKRPKKERSGSEEKLSSGQDRIEQELGRKHDELQLILDSVPALIYYKDRDGRILNMNKATASLTRVPREKLLQKTVFQLMPGTADRYHKDDMEVITSGKPKTNIEEPLELPDRKMWLKTDKLPIKDDHGNVIGLIGFSVDITERKNIEEALRQSQEKLSAVFDAIGDVVLLTDLEGRIIDINSSVTNVFAYEKKDVIGRVGLDLIAPEYRETAMKEIALASSGDFLGKYREYKLIASDGRLIDCEVVTSKMNDSDGNLRGFVGVVRDVTQRKKMEETLRQSEEKYRALAENTNDIVYAMNNEGVSRYIGPQVRRYGFEPEELINRSMLDFVSPADRDRMTLEFMKTMSTGAEFVSCFRINDTKGIVHWFEDVSKVQRDAAGNITGLAGVLRDITERKKAEEALQQSEERYRLIAENMSDVIWIMDLNLRYQYVSPSVEHMRGFTVDEAMGMAVTDYISEESLNEATKRLADELELEKNSGADPDRSTTIDMEVKKKDGSWMWIEVKVTFLRDGEGNPTGLIGVSRDITERRKTQEALRESEQKLRGMFDSMMDGIVFTDANIGIRDVNRAALSILGDVSKEDLIGRNALDVIKMRDPDEALANWTRILQEKQPQEKIEYRVELPNGREIEIELSTAMMQDGAGNIVGFVNAVRDVTARKKAEEALRRNEARYRLLFESSIDGKAIVDIETKKIILANETALKIYGFESKAELEGLDIFDHIHPDYRERVIEAARKNIMFKGGSSSLDEIKTFTKTGEEKWILVTGTLGEYEGKPVGLTSFIDITERKTAEEALKRSEEKYKALVERERDVIFSVDALGFITSINPASKGWGYTVEELIGKNFIDLIPQDWKEKTAIDLQNALLASGELTAETRVLHKDGWVLPIEYSAMVVREGDKYVGAQGVVRDISERKKAEEALRQSEEKFRVMFESIPDGICVIDLKSGKLVDSNPAAIHMFGFTDSGEVIGQDAFNFIADKDRMKAFDDMQNTLTKGHKMMSEWCLLGKGGKEFNCEATAAVIRDSDGVPAYMVNVIRDVTERRRIEKELDDYRNNLEKMVQERTSELIKANKDLKHEIAERQRAEENLRTSEEKLRLVFDSIGEGIVITDLNGIVRELNDDALRLVGYEKKDEIIGRNCLEPIAELDRERALQDQVRMLEEGYGSPNEYRFVKRDGTEFDGELRGAVLKDRLGTPVELLGVFRDITDRKQAEEALRASEARSRAILDAMPDLIFQMSRDGVFLDYKGPTEGLFISPSQFIGQRIMDVMPADIADLTMQSIKYVLETGHIQQYSYELRMKGEMRYFDARMAFVNEEVVLVIIRDITERKKMEDAVKMSEEKLRGIFNSIRDTVVVTDLDFDIIEVNDAALEMSGTKTKAELMRMKAYDLIAPDDFTRIMATKDEAVDGRPMPRSECKIINKLGREMYVDVAVSMYHDPSGETAGFVAVLKDITEHKRMEDALRDSEEKLRIMFSSMADGVVVTDLQGKITDLNETQLRMFGYKDKKEILGKGGFDFIIERDRERAFKETIKVFQDGYNIGSTFTVADEKGKEFECELSTAMLHDADGKPDGFITVMRDVTERRRMEQALRDSEEKLRVIFESIGDGIIVMDMEGNITETNEAAAKLGGWSDKGLLIGMSGFDFVAEQERPRMVADMIRALSEQQSINVEYSVKDRDGKEYQSEANVTLLRGASGSPKGMVCVVRDITERKRMEQDLRDSEEMSRGMIESAATAVCIVKDGKFAYVSPMFAEMTGYTVDDLIGTVSISHIHVDDRETVMQEAVANLKGESTTPHEYRLLRKDGSFIWILEKIASIQYKGERAAIGSLLDITRLKQVEEALRNSEEKLRLTFASLPDGVTVTDLNGRIVDENEAGIRLSGLKNKEQVIGLNGFDFIADIDRGRALDDLPKIFETGINGPMEYRMVSIDGKEYDGEIIAAMMRDKSGNPQGFITVVRDVTEQKKARQELQESQEMTRGMLESAATGIYLVQDGKFKYVNPLFTGISGYTADELLGSDSLSYIHPDDRQIARLKAIENLKGISDLPHEFRFIRKDGRFTWILEKVASIEYKGRRAAIGSFMDISERKRIEEELRQRSTELEQRTSQLLALQKITASIQSTLDLKEILQQVANGVVHNLGFDHALIIKVDEAASVARGMVFATKDDASRIGDVQEIIRRRLTDIEIPQVRGFSRAVDNAMDGKATITHDFFEIASAMLSKEESDAVVHLLSAKTAVLMPLFARDRHVGSILVLTKQEDVGNVLLEPLRILADQAGFAIENADLYHGVSEFAQRLSVISALSKILGSSLDIKGVYGAFIEEIKKVMDFDRTSIAMVEGDLLRYFVVAEEVNTELKDGSSLPLSDSATGLVVKTKRTLIEPDFDKEMKFPIDHMYYRSGLRSAIRVPLFSKGEVFATFNLASKKPNAYGEREKEILEQVSGSLTAAIENSRLFNQVKQHEAELVKAYEDLKSAQSYMLQAEKLRALGEMAGGVAHDFNNVLAVVLGRTQLALEDVKEEKIKKDLQIIEQTAMDAATTVRRLQDFARVRVERNFEVLDLKEVVESALQMAESRRAKLKEREGVNIDIESKLHESATIEGDAAELREGLLNIIFNAMDAMPSGGKITVSAKRTKKWVTLAIQDTGIGIPEEIRTKIFEPFFTTRTHKGTGLGLSVTYSIIQRHRGEISVDSTIGIGSTFYIKLPTCEGTVVRKQVAGKAGTAKSVSILMVDDNPEVAGILGLTLKRLGHKVTEANSGEAAINTFEVGDFDLVITDLGMPDMSGHEVAKIVKELKPGTPVLVISGWGGQLNLDEMPEVDGVIAKPFSKDVLSEKITSLLSGEESKSKDANKKTTGAKKIGKRASKVDGAEKGLSGEEKSRKGKSQKNK